MTSMIDDQKRKRSIRSGKPKEQRLRDYQLHRKLEILSLFLEGEGYDPENIIKNYNGT